jgi:ribosomal protein S18 acetylase RimI-like enzyme
MRELMLYSQASRGTIPILWLAEVFVRCFNGEPWYEDWTIDSAMEFLSLLLAGEFLLCQVGKLGYGIGIPLSQYKDRESFETLGVDVDSSFYIAELATDPSGQGRRIGHQYTSALIAGGRKLGFRTVTTRTREDNFKAIKIFKDLGFVEIGRNRAETGGVESDRILFQLVYKRSSD